MRGSVRISRGVQSGGAALDMRRGLDTADPGPRKEEETQMINVTASFFASLVVALALQAWKPSDTASRADNHAGTPAAAPASADDLDTGFASICLEGELVIPLPNVVVLDLEGGWATSRTAWGSVSTPEGPGRHYLLVGWTDGDLKRYLIRSDSKVAVTPYDIWCVCASTKFEFGQAASDIESSSALVGNDNMHQWSDIKSGNFTRGCWGQVQGGGGMTWYRFCNANNGMSCNYSITFFSGGGACYAFTCDEHGGDGIERAGDTLWIWNYTSCTEGPCS